MTLCKVTFEVHVSRMPEVAAALGPLGNLIEPAGEALPDPVSSPTPTGDGGGTTGASTLPWAPYSADEYDRLTAARVAARASGRGETWETAIVTLDFLAERAGEWVPFADIRQHTGRPHQQYGPVANYTKATLGLGRVPWDARDVDGGRKEYRLPVEAARDWKAAKDRSGLR